MGRVKALWEDEVINVHHEVVHGLITKKEAKEKLLRLLDPWEDEDHFHEIEEEMGDFDKPAKFKSLNVHENIYKDLKQMAKEDNRSIAATVALLTSQARYEKRREWFQKKKIAIREKFMKLGERKNNETK
tara:strand:- start:661 stop:1050 length:390 start_codon:yes stop_codon:yes gene_type:complete